MGQQETTYPRLVMLQFLKMKTEEEVIEAASHIDGFDLDASYKAQQVTSNPPIFVVRGTAHKKIEMEGVVEFAAGFGGFGTF